MRPAVVPAGLKEIELIVGVRPMLGRVEPSPRSEGKSLRIAVTIGIDVAAHSAQHRVVRRNRPIQIYPQRLSLIFRPVLSPHFSLRRQILRMVRKAVVLEPVRALIADGQVQLLIGPER